jgi:hypothetical protein
LANLFISKPSKQEPIKMDLGHGLATRASHWLCIEEETKPWVALIGATVFGLFLTYAHANHELWRDEMHCWVLARNAHGLWDLLTGVRRYDGHPFLWYELLYLVSRISRSVVMLHAATIALAVSSSYLWLRDAPLPRALRVPLLGSYLFFYEYSVLSRSYALGLLFLFLFCRVYQKQKLKIPLLTFLLVLLTYTSAYGAMTATALGIMLYSQGIVEALRANSHNYERVRAALGTSIGVLIFSLGLYLAWLTSYPPKDGYFIVNPNLGVIPFWPKMFLSNWMASLPRCNPGNGIWMVTAAFGDDWPWLAPFLPWLAVVWMGLWLWAFRKDPLVLLAYTAGLSFMAAFQCYLYSGYIRHFGHYFVLLIVCVWLYKKRQSQRRPSHLLHALLASALVVQALTCLSALQLEIARPFSGSLEAARFLKSQALDKAPLIGSFDHMAATVVGYLDRPFRSAETYERITSVVFHKRRWPYSMPIPIIFNVALQEAKNVGRPAILILNRDIGGYTRSDATIERLHKTALPIVADEQFYILRVTPR